MNLFNKFIDGINVWALKKLSPHRFDIKITDWGIEYQSNNQLFQCAWTKITRIHAACISQYIGNVLLLVIYFENEKVIYVTENSKLAWNELIAQIPLRLESAQKYENWSIKLIAQPDNSEPILVYEKSNERKE